MSSKIEDLPASVALTGAELVHVVQGGNSRQTTLAAIAALAGAGYTDEQVRDVIGSAIQQGSGILVVVDDAGNTIGIAIDPAVIDERARDAIAAALIASGLAVTVNDGADTIALAAKRTAAGFFSTAMAAAEEILIWTPALGETVTFADDFAGAAGKILDLPDSAALVLTVKKNGAAVGTITYSTAGVVTFATTGTTVSFIGGTDVLTVEGPGVADATAARGCFTLIGTVG